MKNPNLTESHITAWAHLLRTSQLVLQDVETELKTEGLPRLSWYDLLLELKRVKSAGLRPRELQSAMLMPQYNMSRLLDRVNDAGLIERKHCDEDGRGQLVIITRAGMTMLKKMWPVYRGVLEKHMGENFSENAAQQLAEILSVGIPSETKRKL